MNGSRIQGQEKRNADYPWYLKGRSFITCLALIYLFIFGAACVMGYRHYTDALQTTLQANGMKANLLAYILREHQQAAVGIVQSYAARPTILKNTKHRNAGAIIGEMSRYMADNPEADSVFVTDKGGTLWANYPVYRETHNKNLSYRDWYHGVSRQWKPYVSTVFRKIVGEKNLVVAVCTPVIDEKGDVIGIFGTNQDTDFFENILSQLSREPDTGITLVDQAGQIVFSTLYSHKESIVLYPFLARIREAGDGKRVPAIIADRANSSLKRYANAAMVGDLGWTVIVETTGLSILQGEYPHLGIIATITSMLVFILSLILVYLRRNLQAVFERTKTEEVLRASEEKYRSIVDNIGIGVSMISTTMEVRSLNNRMRTWFPHVDIGKRPLCFQAYNNPAREDVCPNCPAVQTLLDGKVHESVTDTLVGEGIRNYRLISSPVVDQDGNVVAAIEMVEDVTDRRRAELEIKRLNEELTDHVVRLTNSNKELEAFSYSVSHDLRAPLRAVDGYSQILLADFGTCLDDEGRRICSVISENGRTMGKLIDDLLSFSRIGRAEIRHVPVDMSTMADLIFCELTNAEERMRIDFRVTQLPQALGDPELLREVWVQLLSNAVKFSAGREQAIITVGFEEKEGRVVYSVRDNGAGFDMAYADKLFGVFYSVHSPGEFKGVGAGLAIAQRIIRRHKGRVWAEGETDKGATFYFTLKP